MQGAPRRSARSFFVLPLVLALLALVVFPVFARAGEIPEYEVEVPTVENEVAPTHPKKHKAQGEEPNPKAQGSKLPGNSEKENSEGTKSNGTATGNGDGGNHPNGGQPQSNGSESSKTGTTGPNGSISEQQEVATGNANGKNASESSGGGSSPVLPILIAVVVLAAISIGVVLYRQKQQSGPDGPDGDRKPGQGSDGPVSSPNAS